jgi:hypothetical protein
MAVDGCLMCSVLVLVKWRKTATMRAQVVNAKMMPLVDWGRWSKTLAKLLSFGANAKNTITHEGGGAGETERRQSKACAVCAADTVATPYCDGLRACVLLLLHR